MAAEKLPPKWNENRVQHVYGRRDSGGYYVQGYREGKEIWKALGTTPPTLFVRRRQRLSFQLAGPSWVLPSPMEIAARATTKKRQSKGLVWIARDS